MVLLSSIPGTFHVGLDHFLYNYVCLHSNVCSREWNAFQLVLCPGTHLEFPFMYRYYITVTIVQEFSNLVAKYLSVLTKQNVSGWQTLIHKLSHHPVFSHLHTTDCTQYNAILTTLSELVNRVYTLYILVCGYAATLLRAARMHIWIHPDLIVCDTNACNSLTQI